MSESGWKHFLQSDGVEDWVVLHGGAAAVFRVGSLGEAARVGGAIGSVAGIEGRGVVVTMGDDRVSVRLTRDVWQLEEEHVALARAVSAAARGMGVVAERGMVQEVQVAIAAKMEERDLGFWRAVLGYAPMADDNAVDPLGHGSTVWMQEIDGGKVLRHAMHIDVSVSREEVRKRLDAALAAGGRIVDESHAPSHWTLSDRAGNRVCICGWPDGLMQLS